MIWEDVNSLPPQPLDYLGPARLSIGPFSSFYGIPSISLVRNEDLQRSWLDSSGQPTYDVTR